MKSFALLLMAFCLISCGAGSPPAGVLDQERFVQVYCDLLESSLRSRNSRAEPATAAANASTVLEKAGVTREAYEQTRRWYDQDMERWKTFMEAVTAECERRELKPPPLP